MDVQAAEGVPGRRRLWSLREDVFVESDADPRRTLVLTSWGEVRLDEPGEIVREGLRRMTLGPISLENVLGDQFAGRVHGPDYEPDDECVRLEAVVERLHSSVVHSLGTEKDGWLLLSAVPIARQARFVLPEIADDQPIRLSRFAAIRAEGEGLMVLESPLSHYRVVLHRAPTALLAVSLGTTTTVAELAETLGADRGLISDVVGYLVAAAMVNVGMAESPRSFAEDIDPALIPWSYHDLQFHTRSRMGRQDGPVGPVFPFADRLQPESVVKRPPRGPRFRLSQPDLAELARTDPPLSTVVEGRRSHRSFAERPITSGQLGELLFRAARVRSLLPGPGDPSGVNMASDRPYPSAFGLHELELYLAIDRCDGLPRGIYHYDPQEHFLTLVNNAERDLTELLDTTKVTAGMTQRPPVLITMTARMSRISWVYGGIAYATTLKHVGVLQQTLYLAATAMRLASCALAVGDGELAARAFELDWPAECSVGEFIVGPLPTDE